MSARWPRCALIGAGLIGASLSGAARRSGMIGHVKAAGRSLSNLETAVIADLVDAICEDPAEAVRDVDLVILAVPGVRSIELLPELARVAPPTALFTDVGSVKAPMVAAAEAAGLGARFVGAHPLAGKAESGSAAADRDLFVDRLCVLTPGPSGDPAAAEDIAALWQSVGSRTLFMDAQEHDRALSMTSHLPQMTAYALSAAVAERNEEASLEHLLASGFRDTTRLAASNTDMWKAIVALNRANVLEGLDAFSVQVNAIREAVAAGDDAALTEIFEKARRFRHELSS